MGTFLNITAIRLPAEVPKSKSNELNHILLITSKKLGEPEDGV
ncbi:hypothetical protein [Hydrogenobacter thermophilus]|nr:hypothetical protein [Hydrogenobacter thermophilus]